MSAATPAAGGRGIGAGGRAGERTASERAGQHAPLSARPRGPCRPPGASLSAGPPPRARIRPRARRPAASAPRGGARPRPRPEPPAPSRPPASSPGRPQPLPRAAATPPAHVTLAPLFLRRRLPGPRLLTERAGGAVGPVARLGGQPRLGSPRGAGAGLLPGASPEVASLAGFGPARRMACEPGSSVVCGTSCKAHGVCKSSPKDDWGRCVPCLFPGPPEAPRGDVGPVRGRTFLDGRLRPAGRGFSRQQAKARVGVVSQPGRLWLC